ncbi:hypothetical protein ACKI2N_021140 [Cupriavidus sp. 30B13]|uniref:hypothetical protein n=1 Tax=Cupriavidus sp. 30B13 TaxID=3384241 RepID=UPI003B902D47
MSFTCQNQSCRTRWEEADVTIKDEGQGLLFRCPVCNSRNPVVPQRRPDGTIRYQQRTR